MHVKLLDGGSVERAWGATVQETVNHPSEVTGHLDLARAAERGHTAAAALLVVTCEADPSVLEPATGKTPADLASAAGHSVTAAFCANIVSWLKHAVDIPGLTWFHPGMKELHIDEPVFVRVIECECVHREWQVLLAGGRQRPTKPRQWVRPRHEKNHPNMQHATNVVL